VGHLSVQMEIHHRQVRPLRRHQTLRFDDGGGWTDDQDAKAFEQIFQSVGDEPSILDNKNAHAGETWVSVLRQPFTV
jgi:hypothetical protein